MRKWSMIAAPTVLGVTLVLCFGTGTWRWIAAACVAVGGLGTIGRFIFDPNSSFWAPTLWRAPRKTSSVALTFDDGPDPNFTPQVLAILAEKNVQATFFVVGERVRDNPDLLRAIDEAGHLLGNHSTFHDLTFHFRFWRWLRREIDECNALVRAVIGREPLLFRSPQGFKTPWLGDVLRERGMTAVGWQVRGLDAMGRDAREIVERITLRAEEGGVVTLHDGAGLGGTKDRGPTLEALPRVIDALRERGMELVRLDELLGVAGYRPLPKGPASETQIQVKEAPSFVEETTVGTWFIRTPTWAHHVIRVAINDLDRLIPERRDRYPAILDVGCGHGASFPLLDQRFKPEKIVGIDAHLESLEVAAGSVPAARCAASVELVQANAAETGFPDQSFDMVFCHQSFHHLVDQERAIKEFYRLLKPGGVLLFAESTRAYIHSLMIRVFFRHPMDVQKSADEYLALIRDAGFEVRAESVSLPYLWWSRWDLGSLEWWGIAPRKDREETLINAVAVRPGGSGGGNGDEGLTT